MIDFKNIEISDREWISERLAASDFQGCEYSFANNFTWSVPSKIEVADFSGRYVVKWGSSPTFLFPAGDGDLKNTVDNLFEYAHSRGVKLKFAAVPKKAMYELVSLYPDKFDINPDRDSFDYIYNSQDLIFLKGKKYHSKRNFINRFKETDWKFEEIDKNNIDDCYKMNEDWCRLNACYEDESKRSEACVVRRSLKYFDRLGLVGGLVRQNGRVVAFSIGERLNSDTLVVHIEKAYADVAGAYPMINREFAERFGNDFKYINREDDVGAEGLRKAKLSYNPVYLYEKYIITEL